MRARMMRQAIRNLCSRFSPSFYRTIRIVFVFILCSNFMYDVCATKQIGASIETYVSYTYRKAAKRKIKQAANNIN